MSTVYKTECPYSTIGELMQSKADAHPDKNYLIFQEKSWTYREFDEVTNRTSHLLRRNGVKKGDNVAILIPNSPEFLFCYFGTMKCGSTAVTINTLLKSEELEYIINDCEAEVICTTPQYRKMLDGIWGNLPKIRTVILTEPAKEGYPSLILHEEISKSDPKYSEQTEGSDSASIIYTSGTTGHPKGVVLSHSNILYNSYVARQLIDLEENDTALCIMPLFHVNAQIASMMAAMQSSATVVLEEMFKPRTFIQTLKKYRCTTFSGVPTIYNYLNEMKEADGEDLSFLKACVCGAAPMPVEVFHKFEEKFKGKIIEGYGLSEGTCVSSLNPLLGTRKIGSIGISIPGQEMAIWDNEGKELKAGEIGEIVVRGPNVMKEYFRKPEETAKSIEKGWLHTGDLGYRDEEGYYFIVGRKKEMIISGGENIYPKEIEEVLYKHDDISECAVVGLPDKTYGEVVGAFIVPKAGATISEKDVKSFLRPKIAGYKFPKVIEIVTDLPKTATGKIQKNKIVEDHAGNAHLVGKIEGKVNIPYRWVYGSALARFYGGLKNEGKFYGVKCPKCSKVQCPPKAFCGVCFEECTEWLELPNSGILESYTTVHMEFPGQPTKPPYTFGYIKLDGANTHVYHIVSEIPESELKTGLRMEAVWRDKKDRTGTLHDILYFRPVKNV
ncbi:MAG TPA: long-chain-fatty-acid--CoA ligase [Leptospiraceae bacterium]|nr:long-chain-fatty-acid--CoA ligase [Leptospiraceae bacterium]HNF13548.1 long-chain-fatty-acid--CoA ligase [Leptospiraceae bacterium]HNF24029.1 long-chain-fatty-acid--CoA ligase [Leptospiraceae bacterium]HNM04026.1 long-chain-fatty-acid--CoA ligase [Leptospiraceae bacterium]HNN04380.1 long-chain-fatty-acid--CoA ligase [Leptospiraceae bacterium]